MRRNKSLYYEQNFIPPAALYGHIMYHEKKEFVWLEGEWQRINDTDGQRTFENWHQQTDGSLKGKGFTLEGADSVFIENLALKKIDNAWQMIVRGVHE